MSPSDDERNERERNQMNRRMEVQHRRRPHDEVEAGPSFKQPEQGITVEDFDINWSLLEKHLNTTNAFSDTPDPAQQTGSSSKRRQQDEYFGDITGAPWELGSSSKRPRLAIGDPYIGDITGAPWELGSSSKRPQMNDPYSLGNIAEESWGSFGANPSATNPFSSIGGFAQQLDLQSPTFGDSFSDGLRAALLAPFEPWKLNRVADQSPQAEPDPVDPPRDDYRLTRGKNPPYEAERILTEWPEYGRASLHIEEEGYDASKAEFGGRPRCEYPSKDQVQRDHRGTTFDSEQERDEYAVCFYEHVSWRCEACRRLFKFYSDFSKHRELDTGICTERGPPPALETLLLFGPGNPNQLPKEVRCGRCMELYAAGRPFTFHEKKCHMRWMGQWHWVEEHLLWTYQQRAFEPSCLRDMRAVLDGSELRRVTKGFDSRLTDQRIDKKLRCRYKKVGKCPNVFTSDPKGVAFRQIHELGYHEYYRLRCGLCAREATSEGPLNAHQKKCKGGGRTVCAECGKGMYVEDFFRHREEEGTKCAWAVAIELKEGSINHFDID